MHYSYGVLLCIPALCLLRSKGKWRVSSATLSFAPNIERRQTSPEGRIHREEQFAHLAPFYLIVSSILGQVKCTSLTTKRTRLGLWTTQVRFPPSALSSLARFYNRLSATNISDAYRTGRLVNPRMAGQGCPCPPSSVASTVA